MLEICYFSSKTKNGIRSISHEKIIEPLSQNSIFSYNKTGDDHFDLLSAFQKSLRGSDANAAIYYLARLLESGELASVCRRLLVCVCDDVGLAYPQLITTVKSAVDVALQVGMPEARIPLADAVILTALSPKSNSAYKAINSAINHIKSGKIYSPPRHLKNVHYDSTVEKTIEKDPQITM